ncbi:hypothetical protein V493_00727 [Pseudogymnoascus sp. VKM F-4281 (FW-2241)]|nr:hypothetical protein V493_00727 [Pseudogymnoascus sp. VKM F-4281 (FW-2241)]
MSGLFPSNITAERASALPQRLEPLPQQLILPVRPSRPLWLTSIPPRSRPAEVNRLDYQIQRHNGSTTVLELSRQRLQLAKHKPIINLNVRVEELTKELCNVRHEVQFYRQCFEILQKLRETTYNVYEQLLFVSHCHEPDSERLKELIAKLRHGLEESMRREVDAEKLWMEFWGIKTGPVAGDLFI